MLAACSNSFGSGLAKPELPIMPGHLAEPCASPSIKSGQDMRLVAGRLAGALTTCKRRHRDTVSFYKELRLRFAGERKK